MPKVEKKERRPNPIHTQVSIGRSVTIVFSLTWRDRRVEFQNLLCQENFFADTDEVSNEEREMLWLPMPNVIHENAILGNIEEDKRSNVNILSTLS